jgi:TPP-dependent pyruvate/acetoin dehydrogenase alpha subunit
VAAWLRLASAAPRRLRPSAHEQKDRPGESARDYLERYARMRLIRRFEQEIHRLFLKGEVHGATHLSAGQEGVPVGVCSALHPDDYVAGTYRGHGHALAKGTDPEALAAEMLGRATGVCGGRAGSMNVIDSSTGS